MRKIYGVIAALLLMVLSAVPALAQDQSIVEIASGNEDFSTLVAAIQNADPSVLETLQGDGPFTVFAPTNEAFNNLITTLDTTAEDLLAQTDLLTTVLQYHVVPGEFFAEDVVAQDGQSVPTALEDNFIGVEIVDGEVVLNGVVNVVQTDIDASNGVIHVIDDVLLPQSVLDMLAGEPEAEMTEEPEMMGDGFTNIRVAHFSPDTPAVDVYVDGEVAIEALEYPMMTDFLTLPAGTYEIAVAPAGTSIDDAAIGPADFELPADAFVTVPAVGSLEAGTLTVSVVVEDFSELGEDEAHVTVFHAIEDAPPVDVYAGTNVLIQSLAFPGTFTTGAGTPNDGAFELDVPADTYDLLVVPEGQADPVVLDLSGTTLEAGTYYFVAAIGTLDAPDVSLTAIDSATASDLRSALEGGEMMGDDMEEDMDDEDMGDMGTIVDIAMADENFSTLVDAVVAAELAETLSGEGPFTVFAPTNDAFAAALEALGLTAEELLADTQGLTDILLYHVVSGEVFAEDVIALDGQSVMTLQGGEISISVQDGNVFLNDDIQVTMTDIEASNGVIHVIDGVLLPPSG